MGLRPRKRLGRQPRRQARPLETSPNVLPGDTQRTVRGTHDAIRSQEKQLSGRLLWHPYTTRGIYDPWLKAPQCYCRTEDGLILTMCFVHREGSNRNKVREAHKKLMIANHPDSGGSPFIASKVTLSTLSSNSIDWCAFGHR